MVDFWNALVGWSTNAFIALVFGGVGAGFVTWFLDGFRDSRKSKRELTAALFQDFSTLEAHEVRRQFWSFMGRLGDETRFGEIERSASAEELHSFRYVLGFFTNGATLIEDKLIDAPLFFSLTERWMQTIAEPHLFALGRSPAPSNFKVHARRLLQLEERWNEWRDDR